MSKHTAGEWQHGWGLVTGPKAAAMLMWDHQYPIRSQGPDGRFMDPVAALHTSDPDHLANARLIAAAPELLEALQNMVGAFDTPVASRRISDNFSNECRDQARAAIEKATKS